MTTTHTPELIAALKRADSAAFRDVYKEHFAMVRYLVINNSGREEDARDVFQEAMVVLYEKLHSGEFELTSSLKTWLYSVCRNLWMKQLAKNKKNIRFTDFEHADESLITESRDEKETIHAQLRASLGRLGVGCRKLLLLFYYFHKSMDEIANDLGYTNADNVKAQKYKCIQKLKTIHAEIGSK